jgi:hypothetical protein
MIVDVLLDFFFPSFCCRQVQRSPFIHSMKLLLDLVSKSSSSFSPRRFEPSQLTQNIDSCSVLPSSVRLRRSMRLYELTKHRTACLSRM